jgi:hypothetical protein
MLIGILHLYNMQEKGLNYFKQPFILVLAVAILFTALSFVNTNFSVTNYQTKKIDFFSEIKIQKLGVAFPLPPVVFTNSIKDSLAAIIKAKQLLAVNNFAADSAGSIIHFYRALANMKLTGKKVRVAYFGDSMIEGDLLTQDLRSSFQKGFGGRGVGFVPITSIVAGFRQTITHSFSKDWNVFHLNSDGGTSAMLGLSGYVFVPNDGSFVRYTAPKAYGNFGIIKLYYGAGNSSAIINVNKDGASSSLKLDGIATVNELVLNESGAVNAITISFSGASAVKIYGASFESGAGVYVDNYSFRGNSGLPMTKIPYSVMQGFNNKMQYDLIVLHYGLNVVGHNVKSYQWYKAGMEAMVKHFKNAFPNAGILIVSLGDKSYRGAAGWETEPDVIKVVDVQKQVAKEQGVAFWNAYENMGGYNSMKKWVEGDTVFANKDYTHLNHKGAKKMSDIFYKKLMEGYADYVKVME